MEDLVSTSFSIILLFSFVIVLILSFSRYRAAISLLVLAIRLYSCTSSSTLARLKVGCIV